jgi:hypothetical protein
MKPGACTIKHLTVVFYCMPTVTPLFCIIKQYYNDNYCGIVVIDLVLFSQCYKNYHCIESLIKIDFLNTAGFNEALSPKK